jgi:P-type conjugative transfer protein TrbJ
MKRPKTSRRIAALAILLILGLQVSAPPPAQAQWAVIDVANFSQNLLTAIQTYLAIAQRVTMTANQLRQIEAAFRDLQRLGNPQIRELGWFLYELAYLVQQTEGLVYSLDDLDERFLVLFDGYEPADDLVAEYSERTHTTLETLRASLLSTQRSMRNIGLSLDDLARLTDQAIDAEGNLEALEANSILVGYTAQEITKLLQQVGMMANTQAVYYAHELESEAAAAASYEGWFRDANRPASPYDGAESFTVVPSSFPW